MNPLRRLIAYARPYRGRFAAALAAMAIYAAANAGVTYQIKDLLDRVLPGNLEFKWFAWVVIGGYLLKGIGGYFSAMATQEASTASCRVIPSRLNLRRCSSR